MGAAFKRPISFSNLNWGRSKDRNNFNYWNKNIYLIKIEALSQKKISVKAIGIDEVIGEHIYELGKDFKLESGKVIVFDNWGVAVPVLGPGHRKSIFGIDQNKYGKFSETATGGGLLFGLFPFFISAHEEIRFKRVN